MKGEIVTVGSEILIGDIVNTHAKFLSKALSYYGIDVLWHTSVGDNKERLSFIVRQALKRSDFIVFTGGLGPTKDDLTKEIVCEVLDIELVEDKNTKAQIEEYFNKLGRDMPQSNYKQALVPKEAAVIGNKNGTAPGLIINKDKKIVLLLPGPPSELVPMYKNGVEKYLKKLSGETIVSHNVHFFGIGESAVDEVLDELLDGQNPTVGLYAKEAEVRARVTAKGKAIGECEEKIKPVLEQINTKLREYIYGIDIDSLENALVKEAKKRNKKISVAESCTGGMVAEMITGIAGASEVFNGGVVAYSNEVKNKVLDVDDKLIKEYGAVSEQVAIAMAKGVLEKTRSDVSVSTTGIAGPLGGTEQKPVGLVYVGVAAKDKSYAKRFMLSKGVENERDSIRRRAAMHAIDELRKSL